MTNKFIDKPKGRKPGYTPDPDAIRRQVESRRLNLFLNKPTTANGWKRPGHVRGGRPRTKEQPLHTASS